MRSSKNTDQISVALFVCGILFSLCKTAWFGWHLRSQSPAESVCDWIVTALMIIGVAGKVKPISRAEYRRLALYESLVLKAVEIVYESKNKSAEPSAGGGE